jgi:enoyl-CoA hydratase/carnithine racemase
MSDGETRMERKGDVVHVTFDRPAARNAMTWQMYEQLGEICAKLRADASVRAVVFRGAGGKSFIAGTDIAQFKEFKSGEDGVAYEAKMERILSGVEDLPMPTLAVIEGFAVGGGFAIAACCDLRIATPGTRFGVPIARTLGNCLSVANYARTVAAIGMARAKKVLLLAENITAEEALAGGFLVEIVAPADIDKRVAELAGRLTRHAPITMRVTKEAMRRLLHAGFLNGDDLVRQAFGSEDFREGVAAFVAKREPQWRGK